MLTNELEGVNKDVYKTDWQWQEGEYTVTRTNMWTAPGCHNGCSVLYYTKDGKVEKVEGDPLSPYNQGRLCMRCLDVVETFYHPDRLKYPLKRVGERGENKWERISWDEAYQDIADHVRQIWDEYGPECIVSMQGTGRNICWQTPYLSYAAFDSPNFVLGFLSGDSCYLPRTTIGHCFMGDFFVADMSQHLEKRYADPEYVFPEYILNVGNNALVSNGDGFFGHWLVDVMKQGSKLIVLDPSCTWLASKAEYWLQVRPGTDAAVILSTNPIANMAADAPRVYNAMKSVWYNVVVDVFMTPTAIACADLVLPCGMSAERNSARVWWWPLRSIVKVADFYEAKSDEQIILELGKYLHPERFPWETDEDMMTWWIQAGNRFHAGWPHKTDETFQELREKVIDWPDDWAYRKYELGWLRDDGYPGFNTNTGRCELYNTLFEAWGFDPLPYYEEPPESPVSTPELMEEYPYVLTTGARTWEFFHSEERQVPRLRANHPDPLVDLHSELAADLGVHEGDWIWIENMRGKCKQRVRINNSLKKDTVRAEHGWWFPETEGASPNLFGVFDCNINNLTVQGVTGPTLYGAPYANQICKLYPVTKENDMSVSELVVTTEKAK